MRASGCRRERSRRPHAAGFGLWIVGACLVVAAACAHRYSEDRSDWVGPRRADFEGDFTHCRQAMDDAPFRYGGDPRLLFLDCMEKRGWTLKDRS